MVQDVPARAGRGPARRRRRTPPARRGAGPAAHPRTGQAPLGVPTGRGRSSPHPGVLHRTRHRARRGARAALRLPRNGLARPPPDGRHRRHRALELPGLPGLPRHRPGPDGRQHRRGQALRARSAGPAPGAAHARRETARRRAQLGARHRLRGSGAGRAPPGPQGLLHRLHRDRAAGAGRCRRHPQAGQPGARRQRSGAGPGQRADHRPAGLRTRPGRLRDERAGLLQRQADLCAPQPLPGLHRPLPGGRGRDHRRRRPRRARHHGAAQQPGPARQGRRPGRGRPGDWRHRPRTGTQAGPGDLAGRALPAAPCGHRHRSACRSGDPGAVRSSRPRAALRHRGRGAGHGQRHRVRTGRLRLERGPRPRPAVGRPDPLRQRLPQRPPRRGLQRRHAVRRVQQQRPGPRTRAPRPGGMHRTADRRRLDRHQRTARPRPRAGPHPVEPR